ncbi:MAG: hypothetical protein K2F79_09135, partial [Muribaculaceae bacterium]|nr:hypothetical protein [Muribaculaceae bacterium]
MKANRIFLAGVIAAAFSLSSCADLGFGVDVGSAGVAPYFYGDQYGPLSFGSSWSAPLWGDPYWNMGPSLGPVIRPSVPPVIGNGPGSIGMPPAQRPPQNQRPPQQNIPTI